MAITIDNVIITNLNIDSEDQVTFYLYIQNENKLLSGAILLEAVNVSLPYWILNCPCKHSVCKLI